MRESPIASISGGRHLPRQSTPLRLLGVDYAHLPTGDGGDLYVTWDGLHRLDYLLLENWLEPEWFKANRERLPGTSTVYRLPTKPVNGRSIDLVVKYCRVGEDVPVDTMTFNRFANAEFNSALRRVLTAHGSAEEPGGTAYPDPPSARDPRPCRTLWQTGRAECRIASRKARYRDVS